MSKLISFDSKTLERVKRIIFPSPYSGPPQNTHISAVSNISHALAAPNRTFVGKLYNSGKEGSADAKAAAGNNSLMKKSQSHYVSRSPNLGSGESVKSDDDSHRSVKYTSNIDPRDCPANTLRYELVKLMTSLDTQVKRIVAEFVFTLCHNDGKCAPCIYNQLSGGWYIL
ncbi:hypothetical protein EON65_23240 [archaeon]|nr:MAG: hypothetical protein EON65_23240 [archaeon]